METKIKRLTGILLVCTLILGFIPVNLVYSATTAIKVVDSENQEFSIAGNFSDGLVAVESQGKYGFADMNGRIVIELKYDEVYDFSEGKAAVCLNGKWGFVDTTGKEIVQLSYTQVGSFSDSMAKVYKDDGYGYVDSSGKEVIACQYRDAGDFHNGYACVTSDEYKKLVIDKLNIAIMENPGYNDLTGYNEGCYVAESYGKFESTYYFLDDGFNQILDSFSYAGEFHDGIAAAGSRMNSVEEEPPIYKYGYIDKNGAEVVPFIYDEVHDFSDGLARVMQNGKYGYVDKSGKVVIPVSFSNAGDFAHGLACVQNNGSNYIIDTAGNMVSTGVDSWQGSISDFSGGAIAVRVQGVWKILQIADGSTATQNPPEREEKPADTELPVAQESSELDKIFRIDDLYNESSALIYIKDILSKVKTEQKSSPMFLDRLALAAEESAARAFQPSLEGSEMVIDGSLTSQYSKNVVSLLDKIKSTIESNGVTLSRELRPKLMFYADGESINVKFAKSSVQSDIKEIEVENTYFRISAMCSTLAQAKEDVSLNVAYSRDDDAVSLNFKSAIPDDGIKLKLISTFRKDIGVSIMKDDITPIACKMNPLTSEYVAAIKESGVYSENLNEKEFTDIENKPVEMQDAIIYLASKGIVNGKTESTFDPDGKISRAEVAAVIVRALGRLVENEDGGFSDVSGKDWYFGVAGSSKKYNIINGYEDNTFRGADTITRLQLTAIVTRVLNEEMGYFIPASTDKYLTFDDKGDIGGWAQGNVALAVKENIVTKGVDNMFKPGESMTRGDAAVMIKKMFEKIQ